MANRCGRAAANCHSCARLIVCGTRALEPAPLIRRGHAARARNVTGSVATRPCCPSDRVPRPGQTGCGRSARRSEWGLAGGEAADHDATRARRGDRLALACSADPIAIAEAVMSAGARLVVDCRATGLHRTVKLTDTPIAATVSELYLVRSDERLACLRTTPVRGTSSISGRRSGGTWQPVARGRLT